MSETLEVGGLRFVVERSARRRTVGVTVGRDGGLTVAVPEDAEVPRVEAIVAGKLPWVHGKLAARPEASGAWSAFRPKEFVDGESFHLLGKHLRLKIVDKAPGEGPRPTVRAEGDRLLLRRDQLPAAEARVVGWYTRAARRHLNAAVRRLQGAVGAQPAKHVRVADLGYRWGSCSGNGTLNFHWRVVQLPPPLVDYVAVHELCHLREPGHGPRFWAEVRRALPDFEARKAWLKDHGGRF